MKITLHHIEELRFEAGTEDHRVTVDATAGEEDQPCAGMTPPQLFAAAVGACILEFVANSCRLRQIDFQHLSLTLETEELDRPRRLGPLRATLCIEPSPPESVKRRLLGVARHATLVNTLGRPPEVHVSFVDCGQGDGTGSVAA